MRERSSSSVPSRSKITTPRSTRTGSGGGDRPGGRAISERWLEAPTMGRGSEENSSDGGWGGFAGEFREVRRGMPPDGTAPFNRLSSDLRMPLDPEAPLPVADGEALRPPP